MLHDALAPYKFLGLELIGNNGHRQAVSDCPNCGKQSHLHIDSATGQHHCKICGHGGNVYTYIRGLHEYCLKHTEPKRYNDLATKRNLPAKAFSHAEVAWNRETGEWILPVRNGGDAYANLRVLRTVGSGDKPVFMGVSSLKVHLGNGNLLSKPEFQSLPVYVCEGEWDYIALEYIRSLAEKKERKSVVVYVPGAATFKTEWVSKFSGREVTFLFDNDKPGQDGQQRAAKLLRTFTYDGPLSPLPPPTSIRFLVWPKKPKLKTGYDINDLISTLLKQKKTPKQILDHINSLTEEQPMPTAAPTAPPKPLKSLKKPESASKTPTTPENTPTTETPTKAPSSPVETSETPVTSQEPETRKTRWKKPPTFLQVIKEFKKYLHLDRTMETGVAVTLATTLSRLFPGDPLWVFLVGPPGVGKTVVLRSLEAHQDIVYRSMLRATMLVSGFRGAGEDSSLVPKLVGGKTLILKDYTTILGLPYQEQDRLCSVLRDLYDGSASFTFGNGEERTYYDCHFSMVAGVTHAIHKHKNEQASLGERFLHCDFIDPKHNSDLHIRAAIDNTDGESKGSAELRDVVASFLESFKAPEGLTYLPQKLYPSHSPKITDKLIALSQLVALLRTSVDRDRSGDLACRPRSEIGTRLAKQFLKLGRCLAMVFGSRTIDDRCYSIVYKEALDTCTGWNLDIYRTMANAFPKALTQDEIGDAANISRSSIFRRIQVLEELRSVAHKPIPTGKKGQPAHGYVLSNEAYDLWKKSLPAKTK